MKADPERVDAYLAALPETQRTVLAGLRQAVREVAPDAVEGIAYQMPAFYLNGRFLISYAAFKKHLSLFPASTGIERELGDQLRTNFAGRGTIRFTVEHPLSDEVVRRIALIRLREVADEAKPSA